MIRTKSMKSSDLWSANLAPKSTDQNLDTSNLQWSSLGNQEAKMLLLYELNIRGIEG